MRVKYVPHSPQQYVKYYEQQIGGGLPYYSGSVYQRGDGLGALFGSLFRGIRPFLSKIPSWFTSGAKAVGKQALKTGLAMAGDAAAASDETEWKQAAKRRMKEAGADLLEEGAKRMRGSGIKRKASGQKQRIVKKRRIVKRTKRDIFD